MKIFPMIRCFVRTIFIIKSCLLQSTLIPIEDFFRSPETYTVQISPNGENLLFGKAWEHRTNIFVKNIKTNEVKQLTFSKDDDFRLFKWLDDDFVLIHQDHHGDENDHILVVSIAGGDVKDLTPFEGVECKYFGKLGNDEILFSMNKRNKLLHDLYRVNISTGIVNLVIKNPGDVIDCLSDHNGKIRILTFSDGVNMGIRYRESDNDPWRTVATYHFKDMVIPLTFSFDNQQLIVSSYAGRDKRAIYSYDLKAGKEIKCLFEDPNFDIGDFKSSPLIISQKKKKILGCFYATDHLCYQICDEEFQKMKNQIDAALPGYFNSIISQDHNETKYIVRSQNDRTPGFFSLYDVNQKTLTRLFDFSPWLKESKMCSMQPISYSASDGLTIHGYLTLPHGNCNKIPLIIVPHGGPASRDICRFVPFVQFFANRGYAVLQPNFRGSTGFGRRFLEAGFKQWGGKMQDDITEGVQWACNQGLADPNKIVIFGISYGGYAALSGVTKNAQSLCSCD